MHRTTVLSALPLAALLAVVPATVQAQPAEEAPPAMVRASYYQIDYSQLDQWNAMFRNHVAPVLDAMQEEGAIEGYSAWSHDTGGGPYNWRLAMRFHEGANIDATVGAFVERLGESLPAETMGRIQRLIGQHEDQIWTISDVWFVEEGSPPASPRYYVADFQVNPADLGDWNAFYREVWRPALEGAAGEGMLGGFVTLEHAHGGPYNWQIILFAPDWDSLDDTWEASFEAFQQHPERWSEIMGMIRSHTDAIWGPANPPYTEGEGS